MPHFSQIVNSLPSSLSAYTPSHIGSRNVPQILALAASRVEQWSEHSWKWLVKLRTAILGRVANGKRLSTKTMRKDQRVAIMKLLNVILSHLDLKTMQVGIYNPETGVFVHLTLAYLAHKAGLSYSQAQRAMAWLYEGGYIVGFRQSSFDEMTGEFVHKPSIRRVSNHLLSDLGITELAFTRARTSAKKSALNQTVTKSLDKVKSAACGVVKKATNIFVKKVGMPLDEYAEKLNKIIAHGIPLDEAKRMLPRPAS